MHTPAMPSMVRLLTVAAASLPVSAATNFTAPDVALDYVTLKGAYSSEYNITHYRRIPFAASTAGNNRFREPQPPPTITNGTYDTDQSFPNCPLEDGSGSEDCLYLGLYSRPWTEGSPLRPVVVGIHGGGYISGTASFNIPPTGYPTLNVSKENDFVAVFPNYRLNVLGFLAGQEIGDAADAALNAGLLDQQFALQWVHDNIASFGGDPNNVTIFGQSAGGGGVIAQTLANGGKTDPPLFKAAVPSSPFWLKTYQYNDTEPETIYQQLLTATGCSSNSSHVKHASNSSSAAVSCLRNTNLTALMAAVVQVQAPTMYPNTIWAPVIDGDFLQEPLSAALDTKKLNAELVWSTFVADEGYGFVDFTLMNATSTTTPYNSTEAGFDTWLAAYLPRFSAEQLQGVKALYPAAGNTDVAAWGWNTTYQRASYIFRDSVLACPGLWTASAAPQKGYLEQYTISPAIHGSDESILCLEPGYNSTCAFVTTAGKDATQQLLYQGFAGAMASFIQTGDPNAHKVTNDSVPGVPDLTTGMEFLTTPTGFAQIKQPILDERCAFWLSNAKSLPL